MKRWIIQWLVEPVLFWGTACVQAGIEVGVVMRDNWELWQHVRTEVPEWIEVSRGTNHDDRLG